MMFMEKNSREVLQPLIDWMHKQVTGSNNRPSPQPRQPNDSLALKLADAGNFWVGTGNTKKTAYGTIHTSPMYVQYLEPAQRRAPLPVVLVHGGGGQMVHYMGWAGCQVGPHFVQAVTCLPVDRPGPAARSTIRRARRDWNLVTYYLLTRDTSTAARTPNNSASDRRVMWENPYVDQLVAARELRAARWTVGADAVEAVRRGAARPHRPCGAGDSLGRRSVRLARGE